VLLLLGCSDISYKWFSQEVSQSQESFDNSQSCRMGERK
jgi:hypothetical protein